MNRQVPYPIAGIPEELPAGGGGLGVFDEANALAINRARLAHLESLGLPLSGKSVLDVGCGVGHLAQFFINRGCRTVCIDARSENIDRLRALYPGIETGVANVETDRLVRFGAFDVVFCYGLLYHLANPVAGLANIAEACSELLLLETIIADHPLPLCRLADEPSETPNQAVGGVGSRPTPAFIAMALTRLGFPFVYAPVIPPGHSDFQFEWCGDLADSRDGHPLRCIFIASRAKIENSRLALLSETSIPSSAQIAARTRFLRSVHCGDEKAPSAAEQSFTPRPDLQSLDTEMLLQSAREMAFVRPLNLYPRWHFGVDSDCTEPALQQRQQLWREFNRRHLELPIDYEWHDGLRLHLYLGNDLSRQLFISGCADPNEFALLGKLISPGMVAVDAGANDGLYTLFLARRVGNAGQVLAFEPSQREFSRLRSNVDLNRLENVQLFDVALSNQDGVAQLRIASYEHEGQNTLGGFVYEGVETLRMERVQVRRLDSVLAEAALTRLDFLKIDVEGGETRLLQGAETVLRDLRPVILFEVVDDSLRQQESSREELTNLLRKAGYILYAFDLDGLPVMADEGEFSSNMLAAPVERPLPSAWCGVLPPQTKPPMPGIRPGLALWRHRWGVAQSKQRIRTFRDTVASPGDLTFYQYAQLLAAVLEFQPDLVLELGRGRGNSTCIFTEAANQLGEPARVISICETEDWESLTLPKLSRLVPDGWLKPLTALRGDIRLADYSSLLKGARRVLLFWDASGFDVAECVLGAIMPLLAPIQHLVVMHDISDNRFVAPDHMSYGESGLWKCGDSSNARLKIGVIDSAVEQCISALDFTTRNRLSFDSADQSLRADLTTVQKAELASLLGELFDTQGHWFYFTLNERPGPYHFPRFARRR
jgi:FkbM family methyltransferase